MIIIGTSYFPSVDAARRYYEPYGIDLAAVKEKLAEGEAHIGKPPTKPGDKIILIDGGTRYAIEEATA